MHNTNNSFFCPLSHRISQQLHPIKLHLKHVETKQTPCWDFPIDWYHIYHLVCLRESDESANPIFPIYHLFVCMHCQLINRLGVTAGFNSYLDGQAWKHVIGFSKIHIHFLTWKGDWIFERHFWIFSGIRSFKTVAPGALLKGTSSPLPLRRKSEF